MARGSELGVRAGWVARGSELKVVVHAGESLSPALSTLNAAPSRGLRGSRRYKLKFWPTPSANNFDTMLRMRGPHLYSILAYILFAKTQLPAWTFVKINWNA